MNTSVIIASRNEGDNLVRTVGSVFESAGDLSLEVVVVDDGSTDDSVSALRDAFRNVSIVRHDRSRGVSPARVAGVAAATGDVFVFFDAHVKPAAGCIARLVDGVAATGGNAVLIPKVTQFDTVAWQSDESLRGFGYELTLDGCVGRWLQLSEMRETAVAGVPYYESPTVVGCSVAVHRTTYDHIMGFDPLMRTWGMEDVDFGIRAWMTGHPVLCDPDASVAHRFVQEFMNYEGRLVDMGGNQIKMARKLLRDDTFATWLALRGLGPDGEPEDTDVSRFWQQAWSQYDEDAVAVDAVEADFKARRVMDEFAYGQRFGLAWPACIRS